MAHATCWDPCPGLPRQAQSTTKLATSYPVILCIAVSSVQMPAGDLRVSLVASHFQFHDEDVFVGIPQ
eukprot:s1441_g10.t1